MTDTRTIRPAEPQGPPEARVTVIPCVCRDAKGDRRTYRFIDPPDPVLIGAWRRVHERCEG